jgi:hypothetical protein
MSAAACYATPGVISMRCIISGNVVSVNCDVSLTIRDGRTGTKNRCLGATFGSVVAVSASQSPAIGLISFVTIASSSG